MTTRPFHRLLVANRGEIAARVIRSAHAEGIDCVAVFSDADEDAPFVSLADEAVRIGEAPALSSYLDIERVLKAAADTGADAIHPGYGFLSENAEFARACEAAGLVFVGPPSSAIELMGDKARAKVRMAAAGVPCVPGYDGEDQSPARLAAAAADMGVPLLIKAAAGGGGRGMRAVHSLDEFDAALVSAKREAHQAFGDDRVLLEKLVLGARHVEIQVFADSHGHTVHLGERDCSTQRRHQKVLEEAPSPAVDRSLRARMGEAAIAAARAVDYVGAGTVEFLLGSDGEFYFLEMNTRLQVEHPVTEMVTGLDLVALQLRVAAGQPLDGVANLVEPCGHAIEARLYVEDPYADFMPDTGEVLAFHAPTGEGIRCDAGIRPGQQLSGSYDPMVAKLIAHGRTRAQARRRLVRALRQTVLLGPRNNLHWLERVLESDAFINGDITTAYLEQPEAAALMRPPSPGSEEIAVCAALHVARVTPRGAAWSNTLSSDQPIVLSIGETRHEVRLTRGDARHTYAMTVDGTTHQVSLLVDEATGTGRARLNDHLLSLRCALDGDEFVVALAGGPQLRCARWIPRGDASGGTSDGRVRAPATGTVVRVDRQPGDTVSAGDPLLVIEAMKLETAVTAPIGGTISAVRAIEGAQIKKGTVLVEIEPADGAEATHDDPSPSK